jgi:hypothetical protein
MPHLTLSLHITCLHRATYTVCFWCTMYTIVQHTLWPPPRPLGPSINPIAQGHHQIKKLQGSHTHTTNTCLRFLGNTTRFEVTWEESGARAARSGMLLLRMRGRGRPRPSLSLPAAQRRRRGGGGSKGGSLSHWDHIYPIENLLHILAGTSTAWGILATQPSVQYMYNNNTWVWGPIYRALKRSSMI